MNSFFKPWLFRMILLAGLIALPLANLQAQGEGAPAAEDQLSPAALEVLKLLNAGVEESVVLGFIGSNTNAFNLTADNLIYFQTNGTPASVTTAMLQRDNALRQAAPVTAPSVAGGTTLVTNQLAATGTNGPAIDPSQPAVNQFYQALIPFGSWMHLAESGWAWQPHEAATNSAWQPYVDGGRWAWTDHGWYWASDYPWGWAAFHYGRWLKMEKLGWVWFPDTVWAPSWVTWRQTDEYVGWAPLPPNAFTDGRVTQEPIATDYDFGLPQQSYTFINVQHVFVHNVRPFCLPLRKVHEVFPRCRVVNDFGPGKHHRGVVNRGIPIERVAVATGRHLTPVPHYKRDFRHGDRRHTAYAPPVSPGFQRTQPHPHNRDGAQFRAPSGSVALPAAPRLDAAGKPLIGRNNDPGTIVTPSRPVVTPMSPFVRPVTPAPPVVAPIQPRRNEVKANAFAPVGPVHPVAPPVQNERPIRNWGGIEKRVEIAQPQTRTPVAPRAAPAVAAQPSFAPKHAAWAAVAPQGQGEKQGRNRKQ